MAIDQIPIGKFSLIIRLQPLVNLSELHGVDKLKDSGTMLKELRREWDDSLEKKTVL